MVYRLCILEKLGFVVGNKRGKGFSVKWLEGSFKVWIKRSGCIYEGGYSS